jgi:hypothetical protein
LVKPASEANSRHILVTPEDRKAFTPATVHNQNWSGGGGVSCVDHLRTNMQQPSWLCTVHIYIYIYIRVLWSEPVAGSTVHESWQRLNLPTLPGFWYSTTGLHHPLRGATMESLKVNKYFYIKPPTPTM